MQQSKQSIGAHGPLEDAHRSLNSSLNFDSVSDSSVQTTTFTLDSNVRSDANIWSLDTSGRERSSSTMPTSVLCWLNSCNPSLPVLASRTLVTVVLQLLAHGLSRYGLVLDYQDGLGDFSDLNVQ